MAHDKVYGFCENLCKVEVMPKDGDLEAPFRIIPGVISQTVNLTKNATVFLKETVEIGDDEVYLGLLGENTAGYKGAVGDPAFIAHRTYVVVNSNSLQVSCSITATGLGATTGNVTDVACNYRLLIGKKKYFEG